MICGFLLTDLFVFSSTSALSFWSARRVTATVRVIRLSTPNPHLTLTSSSPHPHLISPHLASHHLRPLRLLLCIASRSLTTRLRVRQGWDVSTTSLYKANAMGAPSTSWHPNGSPASDRWAMHATSYTFCLSRSTKWNCGTLDAAMELLLDEMLACTFGWIYSYDDGWERKVPSCGGCDNGDSQVRCFCSSPVIFNRQNGECAPIFLHLNEKMDEHATVRSVV